jgi:hypothetical protein
MIDFGKIIKRAWHILWNYKVLWIFGVLLALTSGGGGSGNSGSQYSGRDMDTGNGQDFEQAGPILRELQVWFNRDVSPLLEHPGEHITTWIWIGVAIFLFILVVSVLTALIRYPSETAVLRMVDEYEQSGTKLGFKQGWKLGWNRRAFRIWVIDLIPSLPALISVAMLIAFGLTFFFGLSGTPPFLSPLPAVALIGFMFLILFAFILLMVFLGLLRQFFVRFAALEENSVGESIRNGWAFFKRNWKSAALMWLILLGIGFAVGIATLILFFLLVPVYVILLIPAALTAALPGLLAYGLASLFTSAPLTWIIGIIIALPFFFTMLFAPLFLIAGWSLIFDSSVWTLTYREMKALEMRSFVESPVQPE